MPKHQTEEDLLRWMESMEEGIQHAIREIGFEAQEMMNHHLSGDSITWSGGTFKIKVNTGNLRRHVRMEYPLHGNPYAVGIFNNAAYASDVEEGVGGEERKRRLLEGGKRPKVSKAGRKYKAIPRTEGSLVSFWTVHEDSTLADIEGRPFVQATEEKMERRAMDLLQRITIRKVGT